MNTELILSTNIQNIDTAYGGVREQHSPLVIICVIGKR